MCLAIPGRIVEIVDPFKYQAVVEVCGVRRRIDISLIADEPQRVADCLGVWVLVHVGFAMSRVNEDEAARTLALLEELGEARGELESMQMPAGALNP